MRSVSRFFLIAFVLILAGRLLTTSEDARGGLISSALIGVLQTEGDMNSLTVIFRAVDAAGQVVWEAAPTEMQRSQRSPSHITYSAEVPTEVAGRLDLEMTMWVYAVRAKKSVRYAALTLRDQTGQSYASVVPTHNLRGRIAEAFVQVKP